MPITLTISAETLADLVTQLRGWADSLGCSTGILPVSPSLCASVPLRETLATPPAPAVPAPSTVPSPKSEPARATAIGSAPRTDPVASCRLPVKPASRTTGILPVSPPLCASAPLRDHLFQPNNPGKRPEIFLYTTSGNRLTVKDAARNFNMNEKTIRHRIQTELDLRHDRVWLAGRPFFFDNPAETNGPLPINASMRGRSAPIPAPKDPEPSHQRKIA